MEWHQPLIRLRNRDYRTKGEVERDIGRYTKEMGIEFEMEPDGSWARTVIFSCQYKKSLGCEASITVVNRRHYFQTTVREQHNHPCAVEPLQTDPFPFDIIPSDEQIQAEPLAKLKKEVKMCHNLFQRMLNHLSKAIEDGTELQYWQSIKSIWKLIEEEGSELRRILKP
ncbi:hypothetical protein Aperf_G00000132064 [Anoplocephala perfoliata]